MEDVMMNLSELNRLEEVELKAEITRLTKLIWDVERHLKEANFTLIEDIRDAECMKAYEVIRSAFKGRDMFCDRLNTKKR